MRTSATIVIERPIEAVWRWAADPREWPRWQDGVRDVSLEAEPEEGARFGCALEYGGEYDELEYEIVERRPPRRQTVRSLADPASGDFESTLELSEHVGGSHVRLTADSGPDDALAAFLFAVLTPLIRRSTRRQLRRQLERLKEMVELEAAL